MNGVHDLGGVQGLGTVAPEANDGPVFAAEWERGAFGSLLATLAAGLYHLDDLRFGIEQMPPAEYLSSRYYEHWLYTLEKNLLERGHLTEKEFEERLAYFREHPEAPLPDRSDPELPGMVAAAFKVGASCRRESDAPPRFKPGDRVVVRNYQPSGHTRLARYLRNQSGVVEQFFGHFSFPDTNQAGAGEQPQPLYNVRFSATDLWGEPESDPNQTVHFDLWESYLEPGGAA